MNRRLWIAALIFLALLPGANDATTPDATEARVRELIDKLPGGDATSRYRAKLAVGQLVKIGTPAVPQLIRATASDDAWVRSWSAGALGGIGDDRAAPVLVGLLADKNELVRCVALWNLGRFAKDHAQRAQVIARQLIDEDEDIRTWAYRSITSHQLTGAAPMLTTLLSHESAETRRLAFTARALLAERLPTNDAREVLAGDAAPALRQTALAVIRHEGPAKDAWAPFFLNAMAAESPAVQAEAVLGMEWLLKADGKIGADTERTIKQTLEDTLPALTRATYPPLRGQALRVLARAKGQEILPQLIDAVGDPHAVVRANALQGLALAGLRTRKVTDAIVGALDDPDPAVRHWAGAAWRWATGRAVDLPYHPNAPEAERTKQVEAIRAWRSGEKVTP